MNLFSLESSFRIGSVVSKGPWFLASRLFARSLVHFVGTNHKKNHFNKEHTDPRDDSRNHLADIHRVRQVSGRSQPTKFKRPPAKKYMKQPKERGATIILRPIDAAYVMDRIVMSSAGACAPTFLMRPA